MEATTIQQLLVNYLHGQIRLATLDGRWVHSALHTVVLGVRVAPRFLGETVSR